MEVEDKRAFNLDGTLKSQGRSETPQSENQRMPKVGPNRKRGRKERRRVSAYRLIPLFDGETRKEWPDSPHWVVEGELEDHTIVSVPVTTSMESIRRIHDQLQSEFGKPVCVITHNMEFLAAKKLPPKEAADVIKRIEDYGEARTREIEKEAARIDAETEAATDELISTVGDPDPSPDEALLGD